MTNMQSELLRRLDALAAKLGTTAAHVWQVYVAQGRVEAVRDSIMVAMLAGVAIAMLLRAPQFCWRNRCEIKKKCQWDGDGWTALAVLSVGIALVCCIVAVYFGYSAAGEWLNPQYWAFQHLMQDLHGAF